MATNYNPFGKLIKYVGTALSFATKITDSSHSLIFANITDAVLDEKKYVKFNKATGQCTIDADASNYPALSKYMIYANGHVYSIASKNDFDTLKSNTSTLELMIINVSNNLADLSTNFADLSTKFHNTSAHLETVKWVENSSTIRLYTGIDEAGDASLNVSTNFIDLANVAATGEAKDITVKQYYTNDSSNLDSILADVSTRLTNMEKMPRLDFVISKDAATTPIDASLWDGTKYIDGELVADISTYSKTYLVRVRPDTQDPSNDVFEEYVTVRQGEKDSYTYRWEKLGNTKLDLKGYVKKIKIGEHEYEVPENSTTISLDALVGSVKNDNYAVLDNAHFVDVSVTTTTNTETGKDEITLDVSYRTVDVSEATANYNGLATAKEVKDYVDDKAGAAATTLTKHEADSSYYSVTESSEEDGHKNYNVSIYTWTLADVSDNSALKGLARVEDVYKVITDNELVTSKALNALDASVKYLDASVLALDASVRDHEDRITKLEDGSSTTTTYVKAGEVTYADSSYNHNFINIKEETINSSDLQYTVDASLAADMENASITYAATGLATDKYVKEYVDNAIMWENVDEQ